METSHHQHDIELEKAVLGAILLESECLQLILTDLKPEIFYHRPHQIITSAILNLYNANEKVDLMTVANKVRDMKRLDEVGGPYYISKLSDRIASSANIENHFKILTQFYLVRELHGVCAKAIVKCNDIGTDIFSLLSSTIEEIQQLESGVIKKSADTIASVKDSFLSEIDAKKTGVSPGAVKFGLKALDDTGGAVNSRLILVGGRPGMGKSALIVKFAKSCAFIEKKPCMIFSLEMSTKEILVRIISSECRIDSELIADGVNLTNAQINEMYHKLGELADITKYPLYIDDTAGITIQDLRNKARKAKREHNIQEIIIDYCQLINPGKKFSNRENEIGFISRQCKEMSKELEVPVILLSQLSRKVEERANKMPVMSDLRDSGSLEQDADQIYFIYRPEYYKVNEIELNGNMVDSRGKAMIELAKNRHGRLLIDVFGYTGKYTEFYDLDAPRAEPVQEALKPIISNNNFLLERNDIEETFNRKL